MNAHHRQIIDKLTLDLSQVLEQIYSLKEMEKINLKVREGGFDVSELGLKFHKTISYLEHAEESIHQTMDYLDKAKEEY